MLAVVLFCSRRASQYSTQHRPNVTKMASGKDDLFSVFKKGVTKSKSKQKPIIRRPKIVSNESIFEKILKEKCENVPQTVTENASQNERDNRESVQIVGQHAVFDKPCEDNDSSVEMVQNELSENQFCTNSTCKTTVSRRNFYKVKRNKRKAVVLLLSFLCHVII